jgi:hypothetical protein
VFSKTLKKVVVGAAALLTLGGATLSTSSAQAFPWGIPIAAGVGVAIGASLAHPYYGPPPPAYVGPGYGPGYYGYHNGCRAYWRWSPRWGRYVRAARCY